MIGVTLFGLLLTPVFYVLVRRFGKHKTAKQAESQPAPPALSESTTHA
jgi:hypothetical protein